MKERIKEIIGEVLDNPTITERIDENTDLLHDIGLDSLTIINLILKIEDEFEVEIDFEEFDIDENLTSIDEFTSYIKSKM